MNTRNCFARCVTRSTLALALVTLVTVSSCAQGGNELSSIESALKNGSKNVSDVLSERRYMSLHVDPSFRQMIRRYAPQGDITIISRDEPGTRVKLTGQFIGKDGEQKRNMLFYFYHTRHDGLYLPEGQDQGQQQQRATLFGYMRTDNDGRFEINTIKPAGYPGERFPSHVHVEVYDESGKAVFGTEFQFADDQRLDATMRESSLRYGNIIAENSGPKEKPVYFFRVTIP